MSSSPLGKERPLLPGVGGTCQHKMGRLVTFSGFWSVTYCRAAKKKKKREREKKKKRKKPHPNTFTAVSYGQVKGLGVKVLCGHMARHKHYVTFRFGPDFS